MYDTALADLKIFWAMIAVFIIWNIWNVIMYFIHKKTGYRNWEYYYKDLIPITELISICMLVVVKILFI